MKVTAGKYREMFLFNPGKSMTCFSAYNAYTRKACAICRQRPGNIELAANIADNELCQICRVVQEIAKEKQRFRERRMEMQHEASSLKDIPLTNPDFQHEIKITGKGIKEWLNQPHKYYVEKNEKLLEIHEIMKTAKYVGALQDKHDADVIAHIFETTIAKEKSWIIVWEFSDGQINLHSITDSDTLLHKIK